MVLLCDLKSNFNSFLFFKVSFLMIQYYFQVTGKKIFIKHTNNTKSLRNKF